MNDQCVSYYQQTQYGSVELRVLRQFETDSQRMSLSCLEAELMVKIHDLLKVVGTCHNILRENLFPPSMMMHVGTVRFNVTDDGNWTRSCGGSSCPASVLPPQNRVLHPDNIDAFQNPK